MENTMVLREEKNYVADLKETQSLQYCSFTPITKEEKKILFKAMNNPDRHLKECVNMKIKVKNIYCESVELTNENTGEVNIAPRIVLIDEKGIGYQSVSMGVYGAVKKLLQLMGEPSTWDEPVEIMVKQVTKGADKNILTFELA